MKSFLEYLKEEVGKSSKSEADYSIGMPKSHCGICEHYQAKTQTCTKVEGKILSTMWCKYFERV